MKESGLTSTQIESHIFKLFPGQANTIVTTQTTGGIITSNIPSATQTFGGVITTTTPATMEGVGLIGVGVSSGSRFDIFSKTISPAQEAWSEQQQKLISFQTYKGIQDTKQDRQQIQLLKSATALRQKQDTKQVQKQKVKQIQLLKQDTKQDSMLKSLLVNLQIGKQTLLQKQILKQPQLFKPTTTTIPPTPIKPIPISLSSVLSKVKKSIVKDEGMFEIFTTKAGKDISIGRAGTQEEAESLLRGTLISSLRAGGFLTKGGKRVRATELKTFGGGEFRLSKASPYKIIEKKEKRLRRKTTGLEIQQFITRGRKSKKNSLF